MAPPSNQTCWRSQKGQSLDAQWIMPSKDSICRSSRSNLYSITTKTSAWISLIRRHTSILLVAMPIQNNKKLTLKASYPIRPKKRQRIIWILTIRDLSARQWGTSPMEAEDTLWIWFKTTRDQDSRCLISILTSLKNRATRTHTQL